MADLRDKEEEAEEGEDADYDPQTEVVGDWKKVDLPQVPVVTGEEEEEVICEFKTKIYRWRAEWKERGKGQLKMLRKKDTGLIRLLARAEKTHKCIVNHLLQAKEIFCHLQPMKTAKNSWTWAAYDISDEKPQTEKLCARFTSKEDFQQFQSQFEKACLANKAILSKQINQEPKGKEEEKEDKEATDQKENTQDQKKQ